MRVDEPEFAESEPVSKPPAYRFSLPIQLAVVAACYFVVGKFGLQFAYLHKSASPIWPATGLAFAALLLWGFRLWPAIFVAAFLVNITTAGNALTAFLIATGNTLEGVTGAALALRYARGRHAFARPRDVVRFWFLSCMLATLLSATIGVAALCLTRAAPWVSFFPVWRTWWLGDAVGGFIASAVILLWIGSPTERDRRRILEATLVFAFIALVGLLVFNNQLLHQTLSVLPALLWTAFRLGRRETAGAVLMLAVIGTWGTVRGLGPFADPRSPNEALLMLQSYLGVIAVTHMTIAAVVAERGRAEARLRAARDDLERRVQDRTQLLSTANNALREEIVERRLAEDRFRRLLESAPDAMVIVNVDGKIVLVNSQTEKMFGYDRQSLIDQRVEMLVPDGKRTQHQEHRGRFTANMHARPMGRGLELHGVRRDGTQFPVEIALSPIQIETETVICAAIRDQTEQKELEARLMAAERQRGDSMRDLAVFVQAAQEEERQRVSRELHDDLGQRLAALKMNMQMFEQELLRSGEPRRARLQQLSTDVDRMIAEVRRLSYNLRPLALDDFGLTVALEMLCREFEKVYKITARLRVDNAVASLRDAQTDIALYRVAQGALANVAKHSGAHNVSVTMSSKDHAAVLTVEDDGHGFDVASLRRTRERRTGLGLIGMRERAEMLGGKFEITSGPGRGTRVEVTIPIPARGE